MYSIKQIHSDFRVVERLTVNLDEEGRFAYYLLKKIGYNTTDAIRRISDAFQIPEKFINAAGTKDRNAITTQYISISNGPKKCFLCKDIELTYVGNGKERLNLGSLSGNYFEIVVRNLAADHKIIEEPGMIPNYYGEQRFGRSCDNSKIGELLLRRKFSDALALVMESNTRLDLTIDQNPILQLRKIPKHILLMYIHSFQSMLWNHSVSEYLKRHPGQEIDGLWYPTGITLPTATRTTAPLIGFGTEFSEEEGMEKEIGLISQRMLKEYGLTTRDFAIRQMPEIASEGNTREIMMDISELAINHQEPDELNPGMQKRRFSFFLGKGSYATIALRALLNSAPEQFIRRT